MGTQSRKLCFGKIKKYEFLKKFHNRSFQEGFSNLFQRQRKIVIFASSLKIGARERLMVDVGKELSNQGSKVGFIFIGANQEIGQLLGPFLSKTNLMEWTNRVPFLKRINKLKLFLGVWSLRNFLKNEKPDALLAVSIPPSIAILTAKILANSKTKIIVRQSNVIKLAKVSEFSNVKRASRFYYSFIV